MLRTFGVSFPLPTALRPLGVGLLPPFTHPSANLCAVIFFCPSIICFRACRQAGLSHYYYDSFFFLCRSSLASLLSLRTVLWNTFHLNTASFLHTVHGSLTPFLLTFYGRPSFTRVYLNAAFSQLALPKPSLYIYLGSNATNTAWSVHYIVTYLNDDTACILFNLNLLDSPLQPGLL